jgi:hypothetical protein
MCFGLLAGVLCTRATLMALHTEFQVVSLAKELVQQEQQANFETPLSPFSPLLSAPLLCDVCSLQLIMLSCFASHLCIGSVPSRTLSDAPIPAAARSLYGN